ncbi:papain-like cysteine protease family protein [Mangrovicoccus sp. HB161399]|uniref:papain-like cysteine protease family protein n=1 Tax=Mangrovicoccus sp. HB161399 TaxID=2720392 RepID=UPI001554730C|nr:papain-like cysteine protease family protein [Mangrovicoccus sp. HB161399]
MSRKASLAAAAAAAILLPLAAYLALPLLRDRSVTVGSLMKEYGYVEFWPPSNLVEPGDWVWVRGKAPLQLSLICGSRPALGFPEDFAPRASGTMDAELRRRLEGLLDVSAELLASLKADPKLSSVESLVLRLENVRLEEVADDQVRAAVLNRTSACHAAILGRTRGGFPVAMVSSTLVAAAVYEVGFERGAGESVRLAAMRELALKFDLRSKLGDSAERRLTGQGLVWGIREDAYLAGLGLELPDTGSAGDGGGGGSGVLADLGPVSALEADPAPERKGFAPEETQVRLEVAPLRQSSPNGCWATVHAMMRNWRDGTDLPVTRSVAALGQPWTDYYIEDSGLPGGRELEFVAAAGMAAKPPANYMLLAFRDDLRRYGPLWVITGDGISSHARLLVGLYGTDERETAEACGITVFEFIDPASGSFVHEPALDFMARFEREAAYVAERDPETGLRWQILHWPG